MTRRDLGYGIALALLIALAWCGRSGPHLTTLSGFPAPAEATE